MVKYVPKESQVCQVSENIQEEVKDRGWLPPMTYKFQGAHKEDKESGRDERQCPKGGCVSSLGFRSGEEGMPWRPGLL